MIESYIVTVKGFDTDDYDIENDIKVEANGQESAIEKAIYIFLKMNPDCHYNDIDILNVIKENANKD